MLRAGLIGFPSSGKTTLFQLMTQALETSHSRRRGDAAVGISRVPDERLDHLTTMFNPKKHVPTTVQFSDPTGQQGLTSTVDVSVFREADALLHVVRAFQSETAPPPSGSVDPGRDIRLMEEELILNDLDVVERRLQRVNQDLKKGKNTTLDQEKTVLTQCRESLEEGTPVRALNLDEHLQKQLRGFQLLSAKPLLLILNLDETDLSQNTRADASPGIERIKDKLTHAHVPVCAKIELEISQLDPSDAQTFLADLGLVESSLDRVIRAAFQLLGYISFFTVGEDECRAWAVPKGTIAQAAAREIHSDIARGFIRAEVVSYEPLKERGSLHTCREHGEVRLEGKEYEVQDGDVINFRFAT